MSTHRIPNLSEVVLVLWGAGGDEAAAVIFARELRMAGQLVKLVGLGGEMIKGQAGVVLVPDMTLGEALPLATCAAAVILPFANQTLKDFASDPRLGELIAAAHAAGAIFLLCESIADSASLPRLFPSDTPYKLLRYPRGAARYAFIDDEFVQVFG